MRRIVAAERAADERERVVLVAVGIDEREPNGGTIYNSLLYHSPEGTLADWEHAHPAEAEALAIQTAVYLAKLAGALQASLSQAVYLFAAPLSQTARVVDALRAKVEAEGPAAAAPAAEATDEAAPAAESTEDVAEGGDES